MDSTTSKVGYLSKDSSDTDRRSRSTSPCPSVSSNSNESVGQESKPTEVVTTDQTQEQGDSETTSQAAWSASPSPQRKLTDQEELEGNSTTLPSIFELPGLTYQRSTAPSPEPSPSPPYEDLEYARVQVPCRVTGRLRPISAMDGFAEGRAVNDRLAWDRWCATTDRVPERLDGYETEDSDLEWEEFEEKRRR